MKKHLLHAVATAAVLLTLTTGAQAQNLAIVNGKAVPKTRMDALAQQVARSGRPITPDVEAQIKEEVIAREIFMQEAQKRGLDATDDFKAQLELARQTILIRELFSKFQESNAVTDADVKAEYDKFVAANGGKEYRARHIGAKLEDLAKKQSKDPGSGAKGGDLDWAAPGNFVKEFSDAMVALKKGETSPSAVKSQFGFHIIRVTDIKQPKQKTFEESRASLEVDAKRQLAQRKFAEAAEQFTNLVYEQSDSLKPAAEKLKLEIQHAKGVGTEPVPAASGTAMNNPKLLAAIFTADTIEKKRNTEAIELAPNVLASARIANYEPARVMPLSDVKEKVREQVVAKKSLELAKKEGQNNLDQWKNAPDKAKLTASVVVSREQKQQLSDAIVEAALRANTQTLPAWLGVDLGSSGYAVVKVEKVLPRETVDTQQQARERQQYMQWWAGAEETSYYRWLKDKFKAEIKASRL